MAAGGQTALRLDSVLLNTHWVSTCRTQGHADRLQYDTGEKNMAFYNIVHSQSHLSTQKNWICCISRIGPILPQATQMSQTTTNTLRVTAAVT